MGVGKEEGRGLQCGDCEDKSDNQKPGPDVLGVSPCVPGQQWAEGKGLCEEPYTVTHVPRARGPFAKDYSRNWPNSRL